MSAAENAGATAVKIVGSGGGGCFFAMTDAKNEQKVIDSIMDAGATSAFSVNLV